MNARSLLLILLTLTLMTVSACSESRENPPATAGHDVSGEVIGGLRVLTIDPAADRHHYRIFRGDYVRFAMVSGVAFTIDIPALGAAKSYPAAADDKPYLKFPDAGSFPFRIGEVEGVIEALEFRAAAYREVTSKEAGELIANLRPFILDVRTVGEFRGGHIEGSVVIPIQELQRRLGELRGREKEPVFIYCKTGNRSTVAAKFLVDAGFEQVINLRRGVVDWARNGYPVTK